MNEEKVLTLRGKRAVWAPAPAGVGVGVQVVTMTATGANVFTTSHTGREISEMAKTGKVVLFFNGADAEVPYSGHLVEVNSLSDTGPAIHYETFSQKMHLIEDAVMVEVTYLVSMDEPTAKYKQFSYPVTV